MQAPLALCMPEVPPHWLRISTIEMHTGGEPLRIVTAGLPPIPGANVLEKRAWFRDRHDAIRKALMWEPRGHADMYGAVVLPSARADLDCFFLHNEGYSTMCGHAVIALTRLAYEGGLVERSAAGLTLDVPAGIVRASALFEGARVVRSSFENVPSFVYLRDKTVDVEGIGRVRFDVAFGGAFYALVDAAEVGLELTARHYDRLVDYGRRIKLAVANAFPIEHPLEPELGFLYGTIFVGPPGDRDRHSRNVCVFADGEVDRSATGSGVSARAALHHARGELPVGSEITIESLIGSTMTVRVARTATFGGYEAVVPVVGGTSAFLGRSEFCIDPDDPIGRGFLLRQAADGTMAR
jgi:trans-L-3-hydroxyproline dehydratase